MSKYKVKTKMNTAWLEIKSQKGQQLNEREVYSINSDEVNGLLHVKEVSKGTRFALLYDITGLITLREFLARPFIKVTFINLLENILDTLRMMEAAYFHPDLLVMDFDKVMVNPNSQNLHFIYVPIPTYETGSDLRQFLLDIVRYGTFMPRETGTYVQDYISILNKGINFSVFELEEYVKHLSGESTTVKEYIECPSCHSKLEAGVSYCSSCGNKIAGNTGDMSDSGIYDPLKKPNGQDKHTDIQQDLTGSADDISNTITDKYNSDTGILGENMVSNGTTALGTEQFNQIVYPYLIRQRTNEKVKVNKPTFRIGKERKYCDYFVMDNPAVSRSHADIVTREGRYYIKDLNSTNRTFLDGRPIQAEMEVEVYSGTKIRLADEDFIFYIET